MKHKSQLTVDEFKSSPTLLRIIVQDADDFCRRHFNKELTITRIRAKVSKESGVHIDGRGIDARNRYHDFYKNTWLRTFSTREVELLLNYISKKYPRNDGKPVLLHHDAGDGAEHFHFQIAYLSTSHIGGGI